MILHRALQAPPVASSHSRMRARFLQPAAPTLRSAPPRGEQWLHEIKFDGWRIQLHKDGDSATVFTKNGHDHGSSTSCTTTGAICASSRYSSARQGLRS